MKMKVEILNSMSCVVNKLSESNTYDWDDEFKVKKNKEAFDTFNEEMKKHIDFNTLTVDDAKELRFSKWSDDIPGLWLIPLYLVPILPEGLEVTSIMGRKKIIGIDYLDNDIRFGCVAYGIILESDKEDTHGR